MGYIFSAIGFFFSDFFLKEWIERHYELEVPHEVGTSQVVVEKFYNTGAVRSFLKKNPRVVRGMHTFWMVLVAVWYYLILKQPERFLEKIGLSLLMAGGLNNLLDRYRKGHVVDYLRFPKAPKGIRNLIFNISDFYIFIGAVLLVLGTAWE